MSRLVQDRKNKGAQIQQIVKYGVKPSISDTHTKELFKYFPNFKCPPIHEYVILRIGYVDQIDLIIP